MPRGDGTGPGGFGSMTGKGMGYCAGFESPGYASGGYGMGYRRGNRRMHYMTGQPGWARYGAYPCVYPYGYAPYAGVEPAAPVIDEKAVLKNQAAFLQQQLKWVQERLDNMEEAD